MRMQGHPVFFYRVASVSTGSWEAEPGQAAGEEMARMSGMWRDNEETGHHSTSR